MVIGKDCGALCGWSSDKEKSKQRGRPKQKDRLGLVDIGLVTSPSVELLYRPQPQSADNTSEEEESVTGSVDTITSPRYFIL